MLRKFVSKVDFCHSGQKLRLCGMHLEFYFILEDSSDGCKALKILSKENSLSLSYNIDILHAFTLPWAYVPYS